MIGSTAGLGGGSGTGGEVFLNGGMGGAGSSLRAGEIRLLRAPNESERLVELQFRIHPSRLISWCVEEILTGNDREVREVWLRADKVYNEMEVLAWSSDQAV